MVYCIVGNLFKEGRTLFANGRKSIGVFVNKTGHNFLSCVQRTIHRRAKELGYDVYFFSTVGYRGSSNAYDEHELEMFSFAPIEKLDGVIVAPDTFDMDGFRDAMLEMLKRGSHCPVVCIRDNNSQFNSVYTDESISLRPLMAHMLDHHGYRDVCFLAGYEGHQDSEIRLACYREEMAKRGIPEPEDNVFYGTMWSNKIEDAYGFFFEKRHKRPEAVVCANDYMAHALLAMVMEKGFRVPEDVAITGFDDIDQSGVSVPGMTTVSQNYEQMMIDAVNLLHKKIQAVGRGEGIGEPEHIGRPGTLMVRESCGCVTPGQAERAREELRRTYDEIMNIRRREVCQTYFSIELNICDTYEGIHQTIVNKLDDIPALQDVYVCLFENEKGYAEEITPKVRLISSVRNRQDCGVPMESFDCRELLPASVFTTGEPHAFHIHLLHQRDKTYGYTAMQYKDGETPSLYYEHWNIIISIALRNLANQFKLQTLYEERRHLSVTDVLTGLYNRRGVDEQLSPMWKERCRRNESVCFISMDLDNLKPINDTYGHRGGDQALRAIADAIREASTEGMVAARIGGDEYLLFIPGCDEEGAAAFKQRFEKVLDRYNAEKRFDFTVGASVGPVVIRLEEDTTIAQCVRESDLAMYQEKKRRHAVLKQHAERIGANYAGS